MPTNDLDSADVRAPFVDVVAGVKDEVEPLFGQAAECREVAGLVVTAAADTVNRILRRPEAPAGGAVFVLTVWLTSSPGTEAIQ